MSADHEEIRSIVFFLFFKYNDTKKLCVIALLSIAKLSKVNMCVCYIANHISIMVYTHNDHSSEPMCVRIQKGIAFVDLAYCCAILQFFTKKINSKFFSHL